MNEMARIRDLHSPVGTRVCLPRTGIDAPESSAVERAMDRESRYRCLPAIEKDAARMKEIFAERAVVTEGRAHASRPGKAVPHPGALSLEHRTGPGGGPLGEDPVEALEIVFGETPLRA